MCLLPFSIRNWEKQANDYKNNLFTLGAYEIKIIVDSDIVPYNTLLKKHKVVFEDGADLTYYEIVKND